MTLVSNPVLRPKKQMFFPPHTSHKGRPVLAISRAETKWTAQEKERKEKMRIQESVLKFERPCREVQLKSPDMLQMKGVFVVPC